MDIEGTDGEERGEDDTAFEGQSALFALAVADILIVNLWYHDIGRQKAASMTLLQTILQIRMTRMPMDRSRKAKLCFILRDMEETPLESLEEKIKSNMEKVAELRGKIISVDRKGVVPAVAFQANARQLWKSIKEEPFLNLPAQSGLMELKKEVEAGPVNFFGDKLHRLMETTLSKYLNEVQYFKEHIVKEREKVLKSEILEILHPLYVTMLGHVRNETFQEFKMMFTRMLMKGATFVVAYEDSYDVCKRMLEKKCKDVVAKLSAGWDWLGCSKELCNEIENYAKDMQSDGLSKVKEEYGYKVADYITRSLECQLQDCTEDTYWTSIREVVRMSTSDDLISNFSSAVATYWEDISLSNKMIQELKTYARNVVVSKLRAEVDKKVVNRMIKRFWAVLMLNEDSTKGDWVYQKKKAKARKPEASAAAIKLLSVMAVVQFDEKSNNCIEGVLLSSLMDANSSATYHLDKNKWDGVSEDDTIIVPWKCKSLWSQFEYANNDMVKEVTSDMNEIKWVKAKEKIMQAMSVASAGAGGVVVTGATIAAGLTGIFPILAAVPVVIGSAMKMTQYFEEKKLKTRQYAMDLLERHPQRLHKRFHGGQSSSQECKQSP